MPLPVAKLAVTAALTAANMALTMSRKIEGPRLDDLKYTGGDYGAPLPMIWGTRRQEGQVIWAEPMREVKNRRKTKGGKYSEYSYFGTWAVAVAGHEIDAITRIWFDTHLVYDLTGAGPVTPFDFGGSGTIGDFISIYLGTETQLPDPRMQATVEAQFGEGSCPAYRGTAYVVFKDIPLAKIGNRIPQVSVEIVSNSTPSFPFETYDIHDTNLGRLWGATFSSDYSRFMWASDDYYEIWDVAARARMIAGPLPTEIDFQGPLGLYNDGTFLAIADVGGDVLIFDADGLSATTFYNPSFSAGRVLIVADGHGTEHWFAPASTYLETEFAFDGVEYDFADLFSGGWPSWAFADAEGSVWVAGSALGSESTTAYFLRMVNGPDTTGPSAVTVTGLHNAGPLAGIAHSVAATHYSDADHDQFVFTFNDHVYAADRLTGAVLQDNDALTIDPYNYDSQFSSRVPGSSTLWIGGDEINLADLSIARTVNFDDWAVAQEANGIIYDPINHALITSPTSTPKITWRYLDRVAGAGVTLGSIAADLADLAGVEDYDFAALDQIVTGWSATKGPAAGMLEPLLDVYDSDIAPHDFSIRGLKRTGSTGGTLLTERFVAGDPRYTVTVKQAAELPRAAVINFADVDADQQPNNARADRPLDTTGARGERSVDLTTLALDADEARGLADRYFRRLWNERTGVSLALTAQQLALEPGDVRTLDLDGEPVTARLVQVTVSADDTLRTVWRYDHPSLAVIGNAAGAPFDGREPSVVLVPLLSKGFVLDVPLLTDSDNSSNPVTYLAAGPYGVGAWPGALIYRGYDGEYSDEIAAIETSDRATWGYATDALGDANPWLWDRGNSVNVKLQVGSLIGTMEAAINANPAVNMAFLGGELLNFTTATLEGDGSYTLSGLRRGRRGTEWAVGSHVAGDVFLLLDAAQAEEMGLSDVGETLSFKAVTSGRTESGAFPIPLDPFTGASLKPYAPANLQAVKEDNGDWTITGARRTRVGGAWVSGTIVPLGEASEAYELDLGDGVTTVTKAFAGTGTGGFSYTWTLADQTTDTSAEVMPGDLTVAAFQISAAVDRGFPAELAA